MPIAEPEPLAAPSPSASSAPTTDAREILADVELLWKARTLPDLALQLARCIQSASGGAWVRTWLDGGVEGTLEVSLPSVEPDVEPRAHSAWHLRSPFARLTSASDDEVERDVEHACERLGPALGDAGHMFPLRVDGVLSGLVAVGPEGHQKPLRLDWILGQAAQSLGALGVSRALEEAHLRAEEEVRERCRAEARLGFLAEAGEILAVPVSLDAICQELARIAVPRLADRCLIHVPERHALRCVARTLTQADPDEELDTPQVAIEALRSRRIVTRETPGREGGPTRSLLAVPLNGRDFTHGVMTLGMDGSTRRFEPEDVSLARALVHRAVLALDKARLYSEAQRARAAAEQESLVRRAAEERQRFLAEASRVLSSSLDAQEILRNLAQLVVPRLADGCVVDQLSAGGRIERVASVHQAPDRAELAWELTEQHPHSLDWPVGIPRVLRTGISERLTVVRDSDLDAFAESPGHQRMLRDWKPESLLTVPLWVRARVVGAVTLVHSGSGRHFSRADQAVAEDLAGRAGLAVENARLYADLQEEDRRKDEFLAMLAHELRNPLAPVQVAVELLQQGRQSNPSENHAHEVIARQTRHMARLVDDLLDLSRITRGKIELRRERSLLQGLVQRAVDLARPLIESKRHHFEVELPEAPLWLEVDPVRIEQVLANLLNNAAKYTEAGGRVSVRARQLESGVEVEVRDSGIGITLGMLSGVFELFVQEKRASDRSQGGLGIGLTLVKQLVELHGGAVSAESEGVGRGSIFRVRLPGPVEAEDPAVPVEPRRQSKALRVLVVDDNVDAAEILAELLETWGHELRVAHDGVDGFEAALSFEPDVVLLDIGLPRLDGLEVARRLRAQPGAAQPVLVALTGYGQSGDRARSLEAGFDYHLTKPVDLDTLVRVLDGVRAVEVV